MFDDNLVERYELAINRIKDIRDHQSVCREYFVRTAEFILIMDQLRKDIKDGLLEIGTMEELDSNNIKLYQDISGSNYDKSFASPEYACLRMGEDYGRLLSFVYVEIRGMIVFVYENRIAEMTALMELFIELSCKFEEEEKPDYKNLVQTVYWFISDYSDDFIEYRVREMLDTRLSFAKSIVMNSDLKDLRYLYRYGEYITDNEIRTAQYLNSLSSEQISRMAYTFTEGYRKGFELGNKDITKKKLVNIRYRVGFERLVREEILQFERMGLETTIYRAAVHSINKKMHIKIGYYSTSPNQQMDYDHRFDDALYLDSQFVERKLGALKLAYDKNKEAAAVFGGPAVMETFGETPFEPADKRSNLTLSEKQQKLSVKYNNEASKIINNYIPGDERSFTIIAYPIPEIGLEYEKIFQETVHINTLDYEKYKVIQQTIIDALDGAKYVDVKGMNGNETDLKISLLTINNPEKETIFENCLADVNIPLGEVFTSPVLKATNGILNVSTVYLNDTKFKNLKVYIRDGMVVDYSCDNYEDKEKGKTLFKENVLFNHDTLPMGEFAIGTNTTAYVMANKYDIVYKLPILIVEKMGPHFAFGDTCYSHSENVKVYNPNGKEIISKDNEISLLRNDDPAKAYYNCHTDITIPYDEILELSAVYEDGSKKCIIREGRFILEGCLSLNEPFE